MTSGDTAGKAINGCSVGLYTPCVRPRGGLALELAVPVERPIKSGLECKLRSPVEHRARSLCTEELMTNFIARLVEHFGTQRGLHLPQNQFNHVEHGKLDFIREIK